MQGLRVVRGGSWKGEPMNLRTSFRYWYIADDRDDNLWFRLVQDIS